MLEKIIEIIADQLSISESEIKPESRIIEDLAADSLDLVEIVMTIENETGVVITDEAAVEIKTVGELAAYVEKNQ